MISYLRKLLLHPRIADLPVLVPCKPLRGLWWSLFPFTAYWRGRHETHWTAFLASRLTSMTGRQVWDIGAHFGYYSLWFARSVGPDGRVYAFEPNPHNFHKLSLHLRRNPRLPVTAYPVAVGDHDGDMMMYAYGDAYDTSSHLPYPGENVALAHRSWPTSIVCLDHAVQRGDVSAPDLIKVDAEGHGGAALAGASHTIRAKLPDIIAGIHSHEENNAMDRQLLPLGYTKYTTEGRAPEYAGGLLDVFYSSPRNSPSSARV